jgi:hypothetical protein
MKKKKITVKKLNVKECLQRAYRNRDNFLSIYDAVKQLVDDVKYCHFPYPKSFLGVPRRHLRKQRRINNVLA